MNIAARCGIRTKNNVLPKYGYKHCLAYVHKYVNDIDTQTFIQEWKRVSEMQEKRQRQQKSTFGTRATRARRNGASALSLGRNLRNVPKAHFLLPSSTVLLAKHQAR